jgi:hypothetical protein
MRLRTRPMHVDQVGARIEVVAPDFLEQHAAGDHLAGVADQEFEQLELRGQQAISWPPRRAERVIRSSSRSPARSTLSMAGLALAPDQHFHACGHLIGGEGLGQVVVATGAQATHAFIHVRQRADHQHRRGDTFAAQG